MRIFVFLIIFIFSFAYDLVVTSKKDMNTLKDIGFLCQKKQSFYVCLSSDDLNKLRRIKDFLKEKYNINAQIVEDIIKTEANEKLQTNQKKLYQPKIQKGYCIQVLSTDRLSSIKNLFQRYKDYPLARIEKIGKFYVLRVGEGSYQDIKNLNAQIKGFVRKCDLIPDRIILSNFQNTNLNDNIVSTKPLKKMSSSVSGTRANLKAMYYYLNSGDLIKAKNEALKLKDVYPEDANFVLGLIAMKEQNFKKACSIFSSLNSSKVMKLKKDACFTYYLKQGYALINEDPKKAIYFFNKALEYKNDINALIGKGYAYLNEGETEKAYSIFKSLYKKYPKNEKIVEGYVNTLYLLKKFDELEKIKSTLSLELQKKLSSLDFYIKLKKAQDLLNHKKYEEAEKILKELYIQKPDDINVLLSLGNLYLQTDKLDKAEDFYKNVLLISSDNIYALKGLEAVYLKMGDYKKALEYSNKLISLGIKDKNQKVIKKFYYISLAKEYLKNNKLALAKEYLKKAMLIDPKEPLIYTLLGDIAFREHKNNLAYKYYAKAYSLAPNNFGIKLKFLYALLNLDLYDQIKIILNTIDINALTPSQKKELKEFYINLYAKYASYLLKNHKYKKALEVVDNGLLMDDENVTLLSTKAWICVKLKKFDCAKRYFELALNQKDDPKLKYGLALVYFNLSNKEKAKNILDSIHTNDKELKLKIADLYVKLGEVNKAKEIIKNMNISKKEVIVPQVKKVIINKSPKTTPQKFFPNPFLNETIRQPQILEYPVKKKIVLKPLYKEYELVKKEIEKIEQNYISNIEIGVKLRDKSGEEGTSRLKRISFPFIEGEYFTKRYNKFSFSLDNEYLNTKDANNTLKHSVDGIELRVGYENENFKAYLGSTPLGTGIVTPTIIGGFGYKLKLGTKTYYFSVYRDSLKDTLTSYVGNEYNSTKFSRIIKNGIEFAYKKDLDKSGSFLYANLSFNYLKGENTSSNTNVKAQVLSLFNIGKNILDKDMVGYYVNFDFYSKNHYKFYPPYGGYFSPKLLFLVMPRYEGYFYTKNKRFISKAILMLGASYLDNWNNGKINLSYDIGYNLEYLLFNKIALEGGIDYRNSRDYNDFFFTFMIRYYFGNKKYFSFKDIDNFSKKVINW